MVCVFGVLVLREVGIEWVGSNYVEVGFAWRLASSSVEVEGGVGGCGVSGVAGVGLMRSGHVEVESMGCEAWAAGENMERAVWADDGETG